MNSILFLLVLLQVKHWYIDFINQTNEEVKYKGIYGNKQGMSHSIKHGIGTSICLLVTTGYTYFFLALVIGVLDFIAHYHIDYMKIKYGEKDNSTKKYWVHFGLDQMLHQITYIFLVYLVM